MVLANPAAVMRRAGFKGFYEDEMGNRVEARFAIVSDETAPPGDTENLVNMDSGDLLAVFRVGEEIVRRRLTIDNQFANETYRESAFLSEMPNGEISRFTGSHLLRVREVLVNASNNGDLSVDHQRLLAGLQSTVEAIGANPDAFPVSAVTQAWMASMIDGSGEIRAPVSEQAFVRKAQADAIRSKIGTLAADHPDGLSASQDIQEMLRAAGIGERACASAGAGIRASIGRMANDEEMKRYVAANDRLCREVFGALTTTSIENLDVAILTRDEYEQLAGSLDRSQSRMEGEWVDAIKTRIGDIVGNRMPGYTYQADLFTEGGRDVLLVRDRPSDERNMLALYSWPTDSRRPLLDVGNGDVVMVTEADIPSEDEVLRLRGVYEGLVGNDNVFYGDEYDDEYEGPDDVARVATPSPYRH